jgi:hypothetical protein
MKKLNNRKFFVTVVMFALTIALMGCGKKTGTKTIEKVTIDETSVPTQEQIVQTTEPIESSNPTVEPIATIDDNKTITEVYIKDSGEVVNSRLFTSYWDYENDTFELEEYLKSTNPDRITILDDDITGFPESYAATYGEWYVAIRAGQIKISLVSSNNGGIYLGSPYEAPTIKPIWLDKYYRLALTNDFLPNVEIAVNTVREHNEAKTFEEMKGYLDQIGQKSEIQIFN